MLRLVYLHGHKNHSERKTDYQNDKVFGGDIRVSLKNAKKYGISFSRYAEGAVFERNERLRKKKNDKRI